MDYSGTLYFTGSAPPRTATPPRNRMESVEYAPAEGELEPFLVWLFARGGLNFRAYRSAAILRRVPACLRTLRVRTLAEARLLLGRKPELVTAALSSLLLGVTEFCRDHGVFSRIQQEILPALLAQSPRIRVWSAACSDGQELYSVAMMLEESGQLARAELLGTDCRGDAIERAGDGVFPVAALASLVPTWRNQHFVGAGSSHARVSGRLRAAIRWRQSDLLQHCAPGPWDLILWRNMAIYLSAAAVEKVWHRLVDELRPGGYLIAGKADQPPRGVGLVRLGSCLYRRPGGRV